MVKCLRCKADNPDDAKKCVKCGADLHPKEAVEKPPDTRFEPEMQRARYAVW